MGLLLREIRHLTISVTLECAKTKEGNSLKEGLKNNLGGVKSGKVEKLNVLCYTGHRNQLQILATTLQIVAEKGHMGRRWRACLSFSNAIGKYCTESRDSNNNKIWISGI